ncbi:hypothetical protein YC2023_065302 [Brassica napus]
MEILLGKTVLEKIEMEEMEVERSLGVFPAQVANKVRNKIFTSVTKLLSFLTVDRESVCEKMRKMDIR